MIKLSGTRQPDFPRRPTPPWQDTQADPIRPAHLGVR